MSEQENTTAIEATPRRSRNLLRVLVGAILIGLIGGGLWMFWPVSGHARMISLLAEISENTADDNRYQGDAELRRALALVRSPNAPKNRFQLNWDIGMDMLRMGDVDGAIEQLEKNTALLALETTGQVPSDTRRKFLFDLALAHLRRGEIENCVCCNTSDSCLLPIKGGGIHVEKRGSLKAVEYLNQVLEIEKEDVRAIWLLNLAHMTLGSYPDGVKEGFRISAEKFESDVEFPRFYNLAPKLGLDTMNLSGGTVIDDFDNDGFLDLVSSTWDTAGQIHCFRNQGDGTFVDRTTEAGLTGLFGGLNLVQADYDNDGDLDVFVMRGAWLDEAGKHPNSLLQNDGQGNFRDVTFEAGLGDTHNPTSSACWADYDLDGDLDLYVGNELAPCNLYQNQGDGTFVDVAEKARVTNLGFTKGVVWGDFDNDRYPDIYVSNLERANRLYRNNGDGTFRDVASAVGVAEPLVGFPTWFWDFNNDGALDIFAASYKTGVAYIADEYLGRPPRAEPDRLYQGDGKGGFIEVAAGKGLGGVTQPMGCNFGDLNNDGFADFYLGTGYPGYEGLMPNLMFLNQAGESFANVTTNGGFGHLQKGHGVAFADLDNDGDQDVFIQMGGAYPGDAFGNVLFQNPGFSNNWIVIQLTGVESNRCAIGCRIRCEIVENGVTRNVYKWVNSGSSFGANPLRQEIGLGQAQQVKVLEIDWPKTGVTQTFNDVPVNQRIRIVEGENQIETLPWTTIKFPNADPAADPTESSDSATDR